MKEQLLGQLDASREYFDRSTRNLSEEDSGFAPTADQFTAAGQVAHVAQTIDWFIDGAFRSDGFPMDFEEMDKKVREVTSLNDARAWLTRAYDNAKATVNAKSDEDWAQPLPPGPVMGGMPRASIFHAIADHTAHHRGALTVYARLRNKVPPMPYMEMD